MVEGERRSLQAQVLRTITLVFGGLTVIIAALLALFVARNVEGDLQGRSEVIARALTESVDVTVGARAQNKPQVERGLSWLSNSDSDLVSVVILTHAGQPIGGIGPCADDTDAQLCPLPATTLEREARRAAGVLEVLRTSTLRSTAAASKPAPSDDPLEAIENEAGTAANDDPQVRILMTGRSYVVQQASVVVVTGAALAVVALLVVLGLARQLFRRVEPALQQARRMAQGDFTEELRGATYRELRSLFIALNDIGSSLSSMIDDARSLGDEVTRAVDRIKNEATGLRAGADQGSEAVAITDGAVAAMQRTVDESARKLAELAATADASSKDTETLERTNATSGAAAMTLHDAVSRQTRSLVVIGDRVRGLSRDSRSVTEASSAARGAAVRMQRTSVDGAERASDAARLADSAVRESNVGGRAIEDAVLRIQEVAQHAGTMEESLRALTERVEGMTPVLGAIADVTSRTSLLALNAGIIAAQAGERGAAFQVVVDELKALARRTSELTASAELTVRTVLEQRGRTEDAAQQLRGVVAASLDDAHRAGAALDAIRASTAESQGVSAGIAEVLAAQTSDVEETLVRIDVLDAAGRSVDGSARALTDEVRVLTEVAERVTQVTDEVGRAAREQGALAARVGHVLVQMSLHVRELSTTQASQVADVRRVGRSLEEIRRFADNARGGASQLESVVARVHEKAEGLAAALHRFRTRR